MEVYRSGHNEPDSKSGCHFFVAREFESLRLREMNCSSISFNKGDVKKLNRVFSHLLKIRL